MAVHVTRVFLAILVCCLGTGPAHAWQSPSKDQVLDQMVELNKKALEQLVAGDAPSARTALLEAVVLGKANALGTHQMMARTYLHLGVVYLSDERDQEKAHRHFALALKLHPDIQMTPSLKTTAVQEAFERARRGDAPTPVVVTATVAESSALPWWQQPRTFFVGMGLGTGLGLHPRQDLEADTGKELPAGFTPAGLGHLALEFGARFNDRFAFALATRHQWIPRSGTVDAGGSAPATSAHAVFARGFMTLRSHRGINFLGTGTIGAGTAVRLRVAENPPRGLSSSDTIRAGAFVLGPGVMALRPFGSQERFALTAELRALVAAPQVALVFDLSVGGRWAF